MRAIAAEQKNVFGDTIKARRLARGYTLRGFARAVPIAASYQSFIESGAVPPPSDTVIERMAELLDMPAHTLLIQAGRLPPDVLRALWQHPAMPAILSTLPGMNLDDAQTFCCQVTASLPQSIPAETD
jgi:HTH-type transcriptional regulator, competence development regulator